jgi:hypothetical protein
VAVIGSGHSAMNAIIDLLALADEASGTKIVWAVRKSGQRLAHLFGGGERDMLPARGAIGRRVRRAVEQSRLQLVTGFKATRVSLTDDGVVVGADGMALHPVDEVIVATGFRPDLSILSEVRLGLDSAVESPTALSSLIDPNVHSCGSVPPHGAEELRHPEPDFYLVGMKSYGRAPTFLMLTGYEQVRSVAAAIAGDWDAARDVRLVLPETGVCSVDLSSAAHAAKSGAQSVCCGSGAGVTKSADLFEAVRG